MIAKNVEIVFVERQKERQVWDETRRDELRGADERCDQLVKVSLPR